jgi:hypothetical protein
MPPFSGLKNKPNKIPEEARRKQFLAGFLIGLFFDPKDRGGRFS